MNKVIYKDFCTSKANFNEEVGRQVIQWVAMLTVYNRYGA